MGESGARQSTRYWQPAIWPGLSCLDAAFTAHHFAPHSHEALVIAVTESGGATYKSRGRWADAAASVLLVFNPAEPHRAHMRGHHYWQYRGLYLARPALQTLLSALDMTRLPGFTSNAVADAALIRAFGDAHRELDYGDPALGRERLIDACGRLIASYASDASALLTPFVERRFVDAALALIHARFRDRISVDELATAVGLSPFQLIRQFNRITGMPPHAHVLRDRLHEAIRQMRQGAGLRETAAESGFYDQSAMTNQFRRAYGITPAQYVRARRLTA